MPASYDFLGRKPQSPFAWAVYCDWAGNREVFDPSAGWISIGNLSEQGMGFISASGGVMTAPLLGATGAAPDRAANIMESLRLEGIDVVTVPDLEAWRSRIVQEVKVTQELSKTPETPGNTVNVLNMLAFSRKTFLMKHDYAHDFTDTGTFDIRPVFANDNAICPWENCNFTAVISGVCGDKGFTGNIIALTDTAILNTNLNLGYPSGWYIEWLANSPPKIRARARQQPWSFNLAVTIYGIGRR